MSMAVRKTAGIRARKERKIDRRQDRRQERRENRREKTSFGPPTISPVTGFTPSPPAPLVDDSMDSAIDAASSEASAAQDQVLTGATAFDIGDVTEGALTPPTTYGDPMNGVGTGSEPKKGKPKPNRPKGGPTPNKGRVFTRVAKTTGTTRREARGVMKTARTQVRRGNTAGARKTISRALSGGPRAGVKRTPARTEKAGRAAKKITKRIATRQAATPKRRKK